MLVRVMNQSITPETKVARLLEQFPQAGGVLRIFGIDPSDGEVGFRVNPSRPSCRQ